MALICIILVTNDIEHSCSYRLFMCLLLLCICVNLYLHLKIGLFFFIVLSCKSSLYVVNCPLSDICFMNIFFWSVACLSIFLMVFLINKFLILMESNLSGFSFKVAVLCRRTLAYHQVMNTWSQGYFLKALWF